jgi:death-on-curing protein
MGEVLLILQDQIRRYGGSYGVRDLALLSSALAMPSATFSGEFLHADIYQQAAAYAYHLCQNHPFLDGNKRTALAAALVFLDLNGIDISDPSLDLYRLMVGVAQGKKTRSDIASTFRKLSSRKRKQ